jgi:hypothetical protein
VPCLNPKKDAEMRIKFFSLLSHLVMNAKETLDSRGKFSDVSVIIVKDIIIPNMGLCVTYPASNHVKNMKGLVT